MNFKEKHEEIELLLRDRRYLNEKNRKKTSYLKGVYIFSKYRNAKYRKIGLAGGEGGLWQRLKYYTICFPHEDEFFIDFIVTTKTRSEPKKLEKLFHDDVRLKSMDNKKASKEYKRILTDKKVMTEVRDAQDKKITSTIAFNEIVKDILEKNRGVWEYVIAFGVEGAVVRRNTDDLDDIVTAYQARTNLIPLTAHNIEVFFKERDKGLFVWTKDKDKYRVGDKLKVEGYGFAVIESLKKDKRGRTNACIKFPTEDTCIMVYDFYKDIKYSADEKKTGEVDRDDDDDGTLRVGDVVAVLAPEKNRRKDGRSFYLGKIKRILKVKEYLKEILEIQDYHNTKEDGSYVLAFHKRKGKGVGEPILDFIEKENVLMKVKSVRGMRGKLARDELKQIRECVAGGYSRRTTRSIAN